MSAAAPHVVHVVYSLGTGGLENGLVNILNRADPTRYRHSIVCITEAGNFARRITAPDVAIHTLHKRDGHDLGFYWRFWRLLHRLKPDVVHSRNLAALETQLLGLTLPGLRRVHGEHGRDANDIDGRNPRHLALRKLVRPFVHRYVAVSKDLEAWLQAVVGVEGERITQIYNGVDSDRFQQQVSDEELARLRDKLGIAPGSVVLGTVGRLDPVKNQALILQALAELREQSPDLFARCCVLLVGGGALVDTLEQQVRDLGLQDKVRFVGDSDQVPQLLQCMDLFLLPSLNEGISNTVLEAMASGLPVIATAVGGNVELVDQGETGMLVPSGDATALATAIASLGQDGKQCFAMGKAARAKVQERFNWDTTVARYLAVYDQVLGKTQAGQGNSGKDLCVE